MGASGGWESGVVDMAMLGARCLGIGIVPMVPQEGPVVEAGPSGYGLG